MAHVKRSLSFQNIYQSNIAKDNTKKQWEVVRNDGKRWEMVRNGEKRWKTVRNGEKRWETVRHGERRWETARDDERRRETLRHICPYTSINSGNTSLQTPTLPDTTRHHQTSIRHHQTCPRHHQTCTRRQTMLMWVSEALEVNNWTAFDSLDLSSQQWESEKSENASSRSDW